MRFCGHIQYHCKCTRVSSARIDPRGPIPKRICGKSWTKHNTLCGKPTACRCLAGMVCLEFSCCSFEGTVTNWHGSRCDRDRSATAQLHGLRLCFRRHMRERLNVLSQRWRYWRGNLVKKQRRAAWPGWLTPIHHSCRDGRMLLCLLQAHTLTPLWSPESRYTPLRFPIQTHSWRNRYIERWVTKWKSDWPLAQV